MNTKKKILDHQSMSEYTFAICLQIYRDMVGYHEKECLEFLNLNLLMSLYYLFTFEMFWLLVIDLCIDLVKVENISGSKLRFCSFIFWSSASC